MPIRVVCKHCGKPFSAWEDLIGKAVKCPKCQQEMVVYSGNEVLGEPAKPAPTQATRPATAPPATAPPATAPPATSRSATARSATTKPTATRPVAPPVPPTPGRTTPPATTSSPTYVDELDESDELPYACPHCHQSMPADEDLCDHCGYHRVLKRQIDISEGIKKPDKSVGFERLFRGQLTDADSAESTLLMIKVVGGLMVAAFLFVCHPWSWLVAVLAGAGYFFYRQKRRSPTAADADPSAVNQDVASSFLWTFALSFQRAVGWREPAWPFPTTKALTLHDATFTDQDLGDVEELSSYETLDLEGTQLSNAGLEQLHKMTQLRNVVVRRTNVTVAGVRRLQQALPKACIWY